MEGIDEVPADWESQSPGYPDQPAPLTPDFSFPISDARNPVLDDNTYFFVEVDGVVIDGFADSYLDLVSQFQESTLFDYTEFNINPFSGSELDFESLPDFQYLPPSPAYRLPPTLTSGEPSPQSSQASDGGSLSPREITRDSSRQVSLPH
jgi:hypothetical protein